MCKESSNNTMFGVVALLTAVIVADAAKHAINSTTVNPFKLLPTCDSQVYCQGPLLEAVQMNGLFEHSKTFVELKMRVPEEEIVTKYETLSQAGTKELSSDELLDFLEEYFEDGDEVEEWSPQDFHAEPVFLKTVRDQELRSFSKKIVQTWKTLGRKVKPIVAEQPDMYSTLAVPNGFITAGGRVRETHYWDAYWIVRGLLISDMTETARGMIENLLHLVQKFGYVPAGNRVYYTRRSQPPLLTKMAGQYVDKTGDMKWLAKHVHLLEKELNYWTRTHQVQVTKGDRYSSVLHTLYRYNAPSTGPRPEMYREDVEAAQDSLDPEQIYIELKSAAESGWDMSSRWIVMEDEREGTLANMTTSALLSNTHTRRIVPVDLNSYMYDAFTTLASLQSRLNRPKHALTWRRRAAALEIAMSSVLWSESHGIWLDWDLQENTHRNHFHPSNLAPLWVRCCVNRNNDRMYRAILNYLQEEVGIQEYMGGVPTSMSDTGLRWDMPNAWPPLQAMVVQALHYTGHEESVALARVLADHWLGANVRSLRERSTLYAGYDAITSGASAPSAPSAAAGDNFAWTNGVALELITMYENITIKY